MVLIMISFLLAYVESSHFIMPTRLLISRSNDQHKSKLIQNLEYSTENKKDVTYVGSSLISQTVNVNRIPNAILTAILKSLGSFVNTSALMIPIGLIINIMEIRSGPSAWLRKGAMMGVEWASISAIFAGSEEFLLKARNIDDRFNSYLSSGIVSSVLRYKEGMLEMGKGFMIGFSILYFMDQFVPSKPQQMKTGLGLDVGRDLDEGVNDSSQKLHRRLESTKKFI